MKKFTMAIAIIGMGITLFAQTLKKSDNLKVIGPGHYKISKDFQGPIKIPFRMHNRKPLMDLRINGRNATLMIDNGVLWDQVWLFGSPLVEELSLKPISRDRISGAGEGNPTQAYTSTSLTLKFKDIVFFEQPVLVSPPKAGFSKMFPGVDGQLCNTFFKHFIVEFDFIENQVILHHPKDFKYPSQGSILHMKRNSSGTYSIPFTITLLDNTTYSDRVDIDFGGIYPLKIALNNKHNIKLPSQVKEISSFGAQGKNSEYYGKIQSMTFGKYTFKNLTAVFGDETTSRIHPDNLGVIGLPLFMKFRILFDYFNNKIYIEPNQNFSTPIK